MSLLTGLTEFSVAPMGRAVRSRHTLCWYHQPKLSIVAMWGRPDGDDIVSLQAAMDADWAFRSEPFVALLDLKRLQAIDEDIVASYGRVLTAREGRADRITRCAVVVPADSWVIRGLAAAVPGLLSAAQPQSEMKYQVFVDVVSALEWLACSESPAPADVQAALEALIAQAETEDNLLAELGRFLLGHLQEATLQRAAKGLGISSRTLQRRLQESATTFQDELAKARILRAKELLSTTDTKLLAIAHEVGYKKQQNFTFMFRKLTGQSPAAWRKSSTIRPSRPEGSTSD